MLKCPLIQCAAGELWPLVSSYRRRIVSKQCNSVQNTSDLKACNPECDGNCQTLLREVVHTDQALYPAIGGQRVHDEIHRPGQVGRRRTLSLIATGRQGQTCKPAGTALRQTGRITHKLNGLPLLACRQCVRPRATWSASLSSMASAVAF